MKSQDAGTRDPQPDDGYHPPGRRATVAALIAVAALTALLLWVAHAVLDHNRLQDCIDSGRRDCLPVDAGTRF